MDTLDTPTPPSKYSLTHYNEFEFHKNNVLIISLLLSITPSTFYPTHSSVHALFFLRGGGIIGILLQFFGFFFNY